MRIEIGIPQSQLSEQIEYRNGLLITDFNESRTNPRAYSDLAVNLRSLAYLHAWRDSEPNTVRDVLREWTTAYMGLVQAHEDPSLTSSCETLEVLSSAWILDDSERVDSLARAIGDPPDASYVSPASEICRPDQQQFAYSVREYVMGNPDQALELCRQVKPLKPDVGAWTTIFNGILRKTGARIPGALQAMLSAHERVLQRKKYPFNIEYGVCLVALGLVAVALRDRLVRLEQLPQSQFLPYQWIIGDIGL